ncbi:MAG: competence/damage-inducible protein A [Cyanobacteria bacterium P01_F01_bin.42]
MDRKAEVISVGSEILLGEILNSNAQYLAQELAILGITHQLQTVVGDNTERLKAAIAQASQRANLLIFTGGLGPTPDDLTVEAIAQAFDAPLIEHSEIWEDIQKKFAARNLVPVASNRKQAYLPQGAAILPNPKGTAPGMIWQVNPDLLILTFPGVPGEMKAMWIQTAAPHLIQQGWSEEQLYNRTLRFFGITESGLAECVADLLESQNPTVAPYASRGVIRLRISAKAKDYDQAMSLVKPVEAEIRDRTGADYFGADADTLASVVGELLRNQNQTLAVAESCTGGGLGARLTEIAGSSDYFIGGVIAYQNDVKVKLLQVKPGDLDEYGAVSSQVAAQMAQGIQSLLNTSWGIGITGIAGPTGGTPNKPVGLVYIGIAGPDGVDVYEYRRTARQERALIRDRSTSFALDRFRRCLMDHENSES